MTFLGYTVAWVVTIFGTMLLRGWALTILWAWFIIPVFRVPALTLFSAIGVSIVIGFLTYQRPPDTKKESASEYLITALSIGITLPLLSLLIGWPIHLLMQ